VGEYHPEIANIYLNMGMMYQEAAKDEAALDAYQLYLKQHQYMYGEEHLNTASCL
jgi:hypothetical protein